MTGLRDAYRHAVATLRQGGVDGAERDARALLAHVCDCPADRVLLEGDRSLPPGVWDRLDRILAERVAGKPVARILGVRMFWGHPFEVTEDVLDPRPETELIVSLALEGRAPGNLLDLGTGSGVLAISLLGEFSTASGTATDISPDALAVADRNARRMKVDNRLTLIEADWWRGLSGQFDLIVSNPPYISAVEMADLSPEVANWDPKDALSPGGDGLGSIRAIAEGLDAHLAPGGRALIEIGAGQGKAAADILASGAHRLANVHADMDGRDRVVEIKQRG